MASGRSAGHHGNAHPFDDRMRIWFLQLGEPLPVRKGVRKMRTAVLADTLVERGHEVVWWASTFDHLSRTMVWSKDTDLAVRPSLLIKALKPPAYRRNFSVRRYVGYRVIAGKFRRLAPSMPTPDIVVTSLPDYQLAYEALLFAQRSRVPIIVDVRDQWPDIFLDALPPLLRPLARLALLPDRAKVRRIFRHADALTSMMSQILIWAQALGGRASANGDRVFPLGARRLIQPSVGELSEGVREIMTRCRGRCVVTFVGAFVPRTRSS